MTRVTRDGLSSDSESPFKVDGDRPLRMKIATLIGIIVAVAGAVGYAVNIKKDLATQGDRSALIEQRMSALERVAQEVNSSLFEQRLSLRLMDQKLDYLTNGRRGVAPATTNP